MRGVESRVILRNPRGSGRIPKFSDEAGWNCVLGRGGVQMPQMKPNPKKAKKPPSKKGAAERVFSASFDADEKLTAVSYIGTVPQTALNREHVPKLVRLMFSVGNALAAARGSTTPAVVNWPQFTNEEGFYDSVLKARPEWFKSLLGIDGKSKEKDYCPFTNLRTSFSINPSHRYKPTAVCIKIGDKTIDSRESAPAEFDAVPKSSATAVPTRSYAAALGKVVLKAATEFSKSLSEHSYSVNDPFKFAGEVMRKIEHTPGLTCVDMHLLSVIPPSAWFQVSDWSEHHEKVQKLAAKAGQDKFDRRRRRIH